MGYVKEVAHAAAAPSAASYTLAVTSAPAAGNLLILSIANGNFGTTTVTDTKSNTWNKDKSVTAGAVVSVFSTVQNGGTLTTADTITINFAGGVARLAVAVHEFSGYTNTVDQTASGTNGTATSARTAGTTATTTNANDLIWAAFETSGVETSFTAGAGYATPATDFYAASSGASVEFEYQIVSGTGAYNPTGTGASLINGGVVVAYKASGAALQTISIAGRIASSEAFGTVRVFSGASLQIVTGVGAIGSSENFGSYYGSAVYGQAVYPTTATKVRRVTRPVAIASGQAFGQPTLNLSRNPLLQTVSGVGAIPSAQAFGTPTKSPQIIRGQGIPSAQAVGTPALIGAGVYPTALGDVRLTDAAPFTAAASEAGLFAGQLDDTQPFSGILDDALLYGEQTTDTLVYTGSEDEI